MSTTDQARNWLTTLDATMRAEQTAQRRAIEDLWSQPLPDRRREGRSLGPLALRSANKRTVTLQPGNNTAETSETTLREGDYVRLSLDDPREPAGNYFYLGEDADGIHLERWRGGPLPSLADGWTIDPDFFDLTNRFAAAIETLGATALGRDRILPLLMGRADSTLDTASYDETIDSLREDIASGKAAWHPSQQEAIASCVSARDAFLVQGPPGTGKTYVLGEVARHLAGRGQRLLVTGPTHRAIDHALSAVRRALPPTVPVAKIGPRLLGGTPVACHESYAESGLAGSLEPHVVGATPHALWSNHTGLRTATFDSVLLDEASQLTPLLAAMAMLRAEKWLFFGDQCQLPPVITTECDEPPERRSVFGILTHRDFDSLLEETWRLNEPLTAWPSATFYSNRLTPRHDRRLVLSPPSPDAALASNPALVLVPSSQAKATVRNEEEAQRAATLCRDLVKGGVAPAEIGIVTPFRAQAARIRQLLSLAPESPALHRSILCDTVERFQGQEREVMIATFVSSHHPFIELRADFLFLPQRLNVAVTRARTKTIVLASRQLISTAGDLADAGHPGATCFSTLVRHMNGS